ncbi:hypothetical protein JTB14_026155 [Gonioctena quinquepunctata]|nr:hypothetical protein JTB14_026155 [Gonioctena quinquepunctata]
MVKINTMKRDIQEKINPADLNIGVTNIRTAKNGSVIIKCPTKQDINDMQKATESIFKDKYQIEITQLKKPKIKIIGYEGNKQATELETSIRKQNKWIMEQEELKVTFIKRRINRTSTIFVECSAELHHKILNHKKIYIDWQRYVAYEDLSVSRCFYRKSDKCNRNDIVCECCTENHANTAQRWTTLNISTGIESNAKYNTNHKTSDPQCSSYMCIT